MTKKRFLALLAAIALCGGAAQLRAAQAGMSVKETADELVVSAGDKPVLEYRQTCNPNKVYVSKLYTPSGLQILLDSPHDHVHHHGLMYALDSGRNSWWVDGKKQGKQMPSAKAKIEQQKQATAIGQSLNWNTFDGKTILKEERKITAYAGTDIPVTLLTWQTVLSAAGKEPVALDTRKHYAGLGIRFLRKMDKIGSFIFPDGSKATSVRGTEKVTPDAWCAYQTSIDDKAVTVAMFSAPSNFRHPTYWFTMTAPFAYISATLNLYRQPHNLEPGSPLHLVYGIAVFDGKQDTAAVEKTYQRWVKGLK